MTFGGDGGAVLLFWRGKGGDAGCFCFSAGFGGEAGGLVT